MQHASPQTWRLIGLFFLVSRCLSASVSINHDVGTVDWTDGTQSWQYILSNHDWAWDNGTDTWSYDATTKVWSDDGTGHGWKHDTTHDLWVSVDSAGTYDLSTSSALAHAAWRHTAATHQWEPVVRTFDPTLAFAPVAGLAWNYNTGTSEWNYTRTATSGRPNVPTAQSWTFAPVTLRWEQQTPAAGKKWDFNRSNRRWANIEDTEDWQFREQADDDSMWEIVGETPVGPGSWDRVQWRYDVPTGVWFSEEMRDSPLTYGLIFEYAYDNTTKKWYTDTNNDGVPETGGTGRQLRPLLPPTPFAHQKALIDAEIVPLFTDGPTWGSSDGSGAGAIDVTSHPFITSERFEFDGITKLKIVDTLTLKGDLEFHAKKNAAITMGDGTPSGDVVIKPASDATHAQLIFNVDSGKTLEIMVQNNLSFLALDDMPLYLTFRGRGTTRFRVPSGKTVSFSPSDPTDGTKGVHVQVLMELLKADVDARVSQLVFAPYSYAEQSGDGAVNTNQSETTLLLFGRRSSLSFLSQNEAGINEDTLPGYGAAAFDVAHEGVGRTVLQINRGKAADDYLDAGINVYGKLITPAGGSLAAADFRTGVTPNKHAGIQAIMRIIDNIAFDSVVANATTPTTQEAVNWTARDAINRRGLVVLNYSDSYPKLVANLEAVNTLEESAWAQHAPSYHPGFILSTNGRIDVWHNLFLDYVGCSINRAVTPTSLAGSGATTANVKWRNPSAMVVDRLSSYSASADTSWDMAYAGVSSNDTHAHITLRGSAGMFVRCGASSSTGNVIQAIEEVTISGPDKLDATIGTGAYNGVYVPVLALDGTRSTHEAIAHDANGNPVLSDSGGVRCLDGEHALIIEGKLTIKSILGRFGFAPHGYVNIPSLRLDHTGTQIAGVSA